MLMIAIFILNCTVGFSIFMVYEEQWIWRNQ